MPYMFEFCQDLPFMWKVVNVFIRSCVDFVCIDGLEGIQYDMFFKLLDYMGCFNMF